MKIFNFSFLLFFISVYCIAQNSNYKPLQDVNAFMLSIEKTAKSVNSIESDFVQEKNMSILTEKIISKGYFCFKKDNLLRWEYSEPYYYLIVLNNGKMTIQDDKRKTQIDGKSNKLFREINGIMLGGVQGTILKDDKKFKFEFFENNTLYLVKLYPQNKELKSLMKRIDLYFEKSDFSVSRIEFIELSDDYTKIVFNNKRINTQVPDSKFVVD